MGREALPEGQVGSGDPSEDREGSRGLPGGPVGPPGGICSDFELQEKGVRPRWDFTHHIQENTDIDIPD